jgi:hypothetical protein
MLYKITEFDTKLYLLRAAGLYILFYSCIFFVVDNLLIFCRQIGETII